MSTSEEHTVAGDGWTIVVPVKALAGAKSRLAPAVNASHRRALVMAMATDVLRACLAAPGVSAVRVVSSDPDVESLTRRLGAEFVAEPSATSGPVGDDDHDHDDDDDDASSHHDTLNAALTVALRDVPGPVGVVTADLPEMTAALLGRILAAASGHPHSIVADRSGEGTTMAFWTGPATARTPRFGVGSAARHGLEGGAVLLDGAASPAAATRDVDTPVDLADLAGRPVGAATAVVIRGEATVPDARAAGVSVTMVP